MAVETINYNYLGLSIVFLILTYYWLEHTKKAITRKEEQVTKNGNTGNHIMVTTKKGDIEMDTNVFEHHMRRMKDNIIQLNQKFTDDECSKLKEYLDNAKINTKSYINLNNAKTNNSSDFCNLDLRYDLVDNNILQEREILRQKLETGKHKTILDNDDNDDNDEIDVDEIQYSILELLIDIDIILFLMRSSMCNKGRFDITSLDSVVLELYNSNCSADVNLSQTIDMATDSYVKPLVSLLYTDSSSKGRAVLSQDVDSSNQSRLRDTFEPQLRNNVVNGREYLSHATHESFSDKYYNETTMISKHHIQNKMTKPERTRSLLDAIDPREKNTMIDHNARYSL
jgi:hypothetical protein